jgi:hypothetical protein
MDDEEFGFGEFVRLVLDAVEAAGAPYCIGGGVAAWVWGEPRTTEDLDLVVALAPEQMAALINELGAREMPVTVDALLDAYGADDEDLPVTAEHGPSGFRADFFLLRPGDVLRTAALKRRRLVELGPPFGAAYVTAPDDLILSKLLTYVRNGNTMHVRDIAAVTAVSGAECDWAYVEEWARRLHIDAVWRQIEREMRAQFGRIG